MKNKILCVVLSIFIMTTNVYAQNTTTQNTTTQNQGSIDSEIYGIIDKKAQQNNKKPTTNKEEIPKDKNGNILTGKNLKIYDIVDNSNMYAPSTFKPISTNKDIDTYDTFIKNTNYIFEDNDVYNMNRIYFKHDTDKRHTVNIPIYGDKITVRYVDPITREWVNTSNLNNLKKATLYIDTDKKSYVVSVPAVYKNDFTNNTLTIAYDEEQLVNIQKMDGYFNLSMSFPQNTAYIGEYWYMESTNPLVDWSKKKSFTDLLPHDLSETRRWSYDGYYFQTPSNYKPSGKGVLHNHPSNYTGARFARRNANDLERNLGYIMTEICMKNMNEYGYWETGPQSDWLFSDFGIGAGFYDTRFNTDFATNLLYGYQNYNNKEFLGYAIKYADYFISYANNNNYKTTNGGILVEDYGHSTPHQKTHVSLNHHLAEMNFLYELYSITKEPSYLALADKMLLGVEGSRNKWVMPNGNLEYAMYYNKDTNKMVDYPYLTYNDLFHTRVLLNRLFNKANDTIEFLMATKKQYMDLNGITGYVK